MTHALLGSLLPVAVLLLTALPLLVAATLGVLPLLGPSPSERWVARVTLGTLRLGVLAAAVVAYAAHVAPGTQLALGELHILGSHGFAFSFLVDGPSAVMTGLTAVVANLVGRFSIHYLHREAGFHRYFVFLHLFTGGMHLLCLASTLDLLFAGWEFVGLSSILLIGYFRHRPGPIRASVRAMITYRITDVALLQAAVFVHHVAPSPDFAHLFVGADGGGLSPQEATVLGLLLLVAVVGKSALLPAGGWLPRAMEGPTPSSALFYGALSVHAGVYLLVRAGGVFVASDVASAVAIALGGITSVHASVVGRVQADAKNRLAFATMAQVGLMVVAVGLHWFDWVLVHMVAHACLRLYQLLRTPSALRDAEALRAALRELPTSRPSLVYRWVPASLRARLYTLALHRFFVDAAVEALVARPVQRLAHWVDALDRRLEGDDTATHATTAEPEAVAPHAVTVEVRP